MIGLLPARNLHLGIRLADTLGTKMNLFVTLNFSMTECSEELVSQKFSELRAAFVKWVRRPTKAERKHAAPPTFVWVIENEGGYLHAHWLLHVPPARQDEFAKKLEAWFSHFAGEVKHDQAIHIEPAHNPLGAGRYMLKGQHPSLAREYGIEYINQGRVTDRRIGHSRNVGPVQVSKMRKLGKFPKGRRFTRWAAGEMPGWVPRLTSS